MDAVNLLLPVAIPLAFSLIGCLCLLSARLDEREGRNDRFPYVLAWLCFGIAFALLFMQAFGIDDTIDEMLKATSPICVIAGLPRLTRKEVRKERSYSRIRRRIASRQKARMEKVAKAVRYPEPYILDNKYGNGAVVVFPKGDVTVIFDSYEKADEYRIEYMERLRKRTALPRIIGKAGK